MKLGPVTNLTRETRQCQKKKKKKKKKKIDDAVMPANCDVIVIFSVYGQFEAIGKPV